MPSKRLRDLDAAIESLLEEEELRPAPFGLHRRIESRIRYVALQDRERRRFRELLAVGAAGTLAVGAMAALAAWHLSPVQGASDVAGAKGYVDWLWVNAAHSWLVPAGAAACFLLATIALAILLGGPAFRLRAFRRKQS